MEVLGEREVVVEYGKQKKEMGPACSKETVWDGNSLHLVNCSAIEEVLSKGRRLEYEVTLYGTRQKKVSVR